MMIIQFDTRREEEENQDDYFPTFVTMALVYPSIWWSRAWPALLMVVVTVFMMAILLE